MEAVFFAAGFLATDFLTMVFLAVVFFAAGFLEAGFFTAFLIAGIVNSIRSSMALRGHDDCRDHSGIKSIIRKIVFSTIFF